MDIISVIVPTPMHAVYITITNHGFGHAARTGSIVSELGRIPDPPRIIVNSTVPRPQLEAFIQTPIEVRTNPLDVGVVQGDSLGMDLEATLRELSVFRQKQSEILREEIRFVQDQGIRLILGDIPPLAAEIGAGAGVPCWMVGNFGWDFIYRDFGPDFESYADFARSSYEKCDLLFRLPFHEPMEGFPHQEDVGVTGRPNPPAGPEEFLRIREALGMPAGEKSGPQDNADDDAPLVLIVFGGMGLDNIPWENVGRFDGRQLPCRRFLTYDPSAPDMPNLFRIPPGLRAADLLPHCELVVTKPGYGIMADAYQAQTGVIAVRRSGFAEAPILQDALRDHFQHRLIEPARFFSDDWSFITEPLNPPNSSESPPRDGNRAIVHRIREHFQNLNTGPST